MNDPTMSRRRLVEALLQAAITEVILGEVEMMLNPPGRKPSPSLLARSKWFRALDSDEQSRVVDAMDAAAYGALHRVLVILDGATSIADPGSRGRLLLLWEDSRGTVDLTEPGATPDLHDLLAEVSTLRRLG